MAETQNYKNHTRFYPLFHFILTPLLLALLIYAIVRVVQDPSIDRAVMILTVLVMTGINFAARLQALRVQDRVIRLEERVRYSRLLSPDLASQAENLPLGQIIALRFASDAELPELLNRVLRGELTKSAEIKQAVKNWRADNLRT